MTQIISFISPKTAGATSVSLNVAALISGFQPQPKVAYLEVAGWASQRLSLAPNHTAHWGDLLAFNKTEEWQPSLLARGQFKLGADVFFSPLRPDYPSFSKTLAAAWLKLLTQKYDVLIIDINNAAPMDWQQIFGAQSQQVVGVVTADPLSLNAWEAWGKNFAAPEKLSWILNQVPRQQQRALKQKFSNQACPLLGLLRTEPINFWHQVYQAFPVAWQRRSGFRKDLRALLPQLLKA